VAQEEARMSELAARRSEPTTDGVPLGVRIAERPLVVLVLMLALLVVVTGVVQPGYFSVSGIRNTLIIAAPLGLLAASQTILMLTGGIDLSVAMIATGAAYVAGNQSPRGAAIAIALGLVVGAISGALNGLGVGVFRINPLIMTLAMSAILLGVFSVLAQTVLIGSTSVGPFIKLLGGGSFLGGRIPYGVVVWAAVSVLIILMLRRTGFGRLLYAVGDNPVAVRLAGVRTWRVLLAAYTVAGVLAALAGILLAGRTGAVDLQLAGSFLLPSVAAAVIGGTSIFGGSGDYTGTIVGALILSVLNSLLTFLNVGQGIQQIVYGLIVLALSWLYSSVAARGG
jgi:ribose transport system permease protein